MKLPNFEFKNPTGKTLSKPEKAQQLRESFAKKVSVVSALRRDIEDQKISSLSPDDFKRWTQERKKQLSSEFPEAQKALEALKQKEKELYILISKCAELEHQDNLLDERAFLAYKKANPESVEEDAVEVEYDILYKYFSEIDQKELSRIIGKQAVLTKKIADLEQQNRKTLFHSENPFLYTSLRFLEGISNKRSEVEDLRIAYEGGPNDFSRAMDRLAREKEEPLFNLRSYLTEKFSELQIEFTAYDIVVHIAKEDAENYFKETSRGWHHPDTPFCFIVRADDVEQQNYTKTHELGHNRIECAEVAGVHNTVYIQASLPNLQKQISILRNLKLLKTPHSILANSEEFVKMSVRNQLYYLNGEISADIGNIVKGRFSSFYFHFIKSASALEKLTQKKRGDAEDETTQMVEEELSALEAKTAAHLKEVLFFSFLSRKYRKEDEFCSILLMDPDSPRLLRRFFSEELGDSFVYEKQMHELLPETTLPEAIHQRVYDLSQHSVGVLRRMELRKDEQFMHMLPPDKPMPLEHDWRKWKDYSSFERIFANQYSATKLLSPEHLPSFLATTGKRSVNEIDQRAVGKIRGLLEDFLGNYRFSSIFDSEFFPESASTGSWSKLIDQTRTYEANMLKLCKYIDSREVGESIAKQIYETTVYKALKASVMIDDPTPIKQVFDQWKIQVEKDEYFKSGKFLGKYDVGDWFDDLEENDANKTLKDRFLNTPEQTRVYKYLVPILEAQQAENKKSANTN